MAFNCVAQQPDAATLNDQGVALRRRGQPAAAVKVLRKAAALRPDDARIHSNLSLALRDAGKLAEAVSEMEQAAKLDPGNRQIEHNLGILYRASGIAAQKRGDLEAAIASLRKAGEKLPEDASVRYNLGRALEAAGRSEEAAAELQAANELNARARDAIRAKALNNQGNALLQQGRLQQGEAKLREAVALAPDDAVSQYNLVKKAQFAKLRYSGPAERPSGSLTFAPIRS